MTRAAKVAAAKPPPIVLAWMESKRHLFRVFGKPERSSLDYRLLRYFEKEYPDACK